MMNITDAMKHAERYRIVEPIEEIECPFCHQVVFVRSGFVGGHMVECGHRMGTLCPQSNRHIDGKPMNQWTGELL